MSKTDRLSLVASIASRAGRVLAACAAHAMNPNQARRVLRRVCPRRNFTRPSHA